MIKVECEGSNFYFKNAEDFSKLFKVSKNTVDMWLNKKCKPRKSLGIQRIYVNNELIFGTGGKNENKKLSSKM